jgi:hypothetical protein
MLLALASVVFLGSETLWTRNHILQSQIWDFPFRRLLRLAGSRWRYSTPPPHRVNLNWTTLNLISSRNGPTENTSRDHYLLLWCDVTVHMQAAQTQRKHCCCIVGRVCCRYCLAMDLHVTIQGDSGAKIVIWIWVLYTIFTELRSHLETHYCELHVAFTNLSTWCVCSQWDTVRCSSMKAHLLTSTVRWWNI